MATRATDAVAKSIEAIEPRTVGKFLFTSGSTGLPKAVINTQEMMCANVAMMSMARVRKADAPAPVMLDWLPWNHTMGGNATLQGNLNEGGTTFIFVTEGVEAALEQARAAAGDLDVKIGGGVETVRQYLRAGLIDELHFALSPVVLGQGEAMFAGIDLPALGFRVTEHQASEHATHIVLAR